MKKFIIRNISLVAFSMIVLLNSCQSDDDITTTLPQIPETITISQTGLYPEGIDFNTRNNQFIIGSVGKSEVGSIDPITGDYTTLITDTNLISVTGVLVDETRNRLLVVSGNLGFSANSSSSTVAYLGIYNLETNALIQSINLKELLPENASVFANDIAIDDAGNIYITDSFSPVVYKVNGTSFEASIFVNGGEQFTPAPGAFGLNGIVFTNGNLIVSKTDNGALFKIPVSDPNNFAKIDTPEFVGADGLELDNENNIVLVENGLGANPGTKILSSNNDWDTATVVSSFDLDSDKFPTTATTAYDGNVYVLNSFLGLALNGNLTQNTFSIQKTK